MSFIKFTKRNIRRTPYQASAALMIMFLTFLSLSFFMILASGSQKILRFYESKPQAIAFFKDNTTQSDVQAISQALNQTGKVTKLKFVSKDEALQIYKERNKNNPTLLELVTANILPASLEISSQTPDDLKPIAKILKKEPVVEEVVFPEDVIAALTSATRLIRGVGGGVVSFLFIFSILIIIMIIGFKIRIRRDEIETEKLLGASTWFIRMPFIAEGIFYAVVGSIFGWGVSLFVLWYIEPLLKINLGEVTQVLLPVPIIYVVGLLAINLILAFFIGAIGSYSAVRRYLRF